MKVNKIQVPARSLRVHPIVAMEYRRKSLLSLTVKTALTYLKVWQTLPYTTPVETATFLKKSHGNLRAVS